MRIPTKLLKSAYYYNCESGKLIFDSQYCDICRKRYRPNKNKRKYNKFSSFKPWSTHVLNLLDKKGVRIEKPDDVRNIFKYMPRPQRIALYYPLADHVWLWFGRDIPDGKHVKSLVDMLFEHPPETRTKIQYLYLANDD